MPRHLYTICEREYAPNDSTKSYENGERSVIRYLPAVPAQPFGLNAVINPAHPHHRKLLFDEPIEVEWDERLFS